MSCKKNIAIHHSWKCCGSFSAGHSPLMQESVPQFCTKLVGLVVNHCAVAMSTEGNSRLAWHVTPKHYFSVAYRFGGMTRNMLQWRPDNHNKAPCGALKMSSTITAFYIINAQMTLKWMYVGIRTWAYQNQITTQQSYVFIPHCWRYNFVVQPKQIGHQPRITDVHDCPAVTDFTNSA